MNEETCSSIKGNKYLQQAGVDLSGIQVLELEPDSSPVDCQAAMVIADAKAQQQWPDVMLLSWYDHDRDFESPQHSSECHLDSAVPGCVDYGISHGAKLIIDIKKGRFVFSICRLSCNVTK